MAFGSCAAPVPEDPYPEATGSVWALSIPAGDDTLRVAALLLQYPEVNALFVPIFTQDEMLFLLIKNTFSAQKTENRNALLLDVERDEYTIILCIIQQCRAHFKFVDVLM